METSNLETLKDFDIDSLPDLDVVTLGALELFAATELPQVDFGEFKKPLVVGSVGAYAASTIVFNNTSAVLADESSYTGALETNPDIDGAFLLSASGSKHAIELAKELMKRNIPTRLITNNKVAPALGIVGTENTFVFPKNREPYTYNTSTYMGMIFARTKESPEAIHQFIEEQVKDLIPKNIGEYGAYVFIVPPYFHNVRKQFLIKYDELFGPYAVGRAFTTEEMKHAKTVVTSPKEVFISFGEKDPQAHLRSNYVHIPLPEGADYAAMMAIAYYTVGRIQAGKPAYFKGRIREYCREASEIFGNELKPIVE